MKTLALISHKGGTGKSTLAVHLSVVAEQHGLETLLVDLDSISSTASAWAANRESKQPLVVTAQLADVGALCEQAKGEGFDLLILDFPPYFSDDVLNAITVSDYALLLVLPRFPELQSLSKYIDAVECDYSLVLNTCSNNEAKLVSKMLNENGIPVTEVCIGRHDAFSDALNFGLGVTEYELNGKAAEQIKELFNEHIN